MFTKSFWKAAADLALQTIAVAAATYQAELDSLPIADTPQKL